MNAYCVITLMSSRLGKRKLNITAVQYLCCFLFVCMHHMLTYLFLMSQHICLVQHSTIMLSNPEYERHRLARIAMLRAEVAATSIMNLKFIGPFGKLSLRWHLISP